MSPGQAIIITVGSFGLVLFGFIISAEMELSDMELFLAGIGFGSGCATLAQIATTHLSNNLCLKCKEEAEAKIRVKPTDAVR